MAISLQSYILGSNQTVTLGHAHAQVQTYFTQIMKDFSRPYLEAYQWGQKFSIIENIDEENSIGNYCSQVGRTAAGIILTILAIGLFSFFFTTYESHFGYMGGVCGFLGIAALTSVIWVSIRHTRKVRELKSEELSVEKVTHLVNQIAEVLKRRNQEGLE